MLDPARGPARPATRTPAKLHRRVQLVVTEDAILAEELLARKGLAKEVAGRLSDRVLLLRPGRVGAVLQELRDAGHTPRYVPPTGPSNDAATA